MFMDNILKRKPSYYMDGIKEGDAEEDNFAFFYNCFEEIKEHEEVKNVVINLCNNGGGDCVLGTFVDAYGIAEAVHRYQGGETAADYSEEEEEQITGFLEMLFERMNASGEAASEPAAAQ